MTRSWVAETERWGTTPVQAYVRLRGGELGYFRARGSSASFEVWASGTAVGSEGRVAP